MPDDTKDDAKAAKEAEAKAAKQKAEDDAKAAKEAEAKAKRIDEGTADELLRRAKLAGASENSLSELREALAEASVAELPSFVEQIGKLRRKNRKTYHVVSNGSVLHDGEHYEHGESLLLTDAEAADLGEGIVAPGTAPPPPVDAATRKGGKYRVAEERNVMHGGRMYGPGSVLELSAEDARSIGDYVVEA